MIAPSTKLSPFRQGPAQNVWRSHANRSLVDRGEPQSRVIYLHRGGPIEPGLAPFGSVSYHDCRPATIVRTWRR